VDNLSSCVAKSLAIIIFKRKKKITRFNPLLYNNTETHAIMERSNSILYILLYETYIMLNAFELKRKR